MLGHTYVCMGFKGYRHFICEELVTLVPKCREIANQSLNVAIG